MQIEILINNNSYQTWESFFRPLFRLVTQSREAKKRPRRRSHTSLTSDLAHSRFFFSLYVYFVECRLMENKPLAEKVWSLFPYVFPTFGAQAITMTTATTMAPTKKVTKGFTCTLVFMFLHIYSLFYVKQQET